MLHTQPESGQWCHVGGLCPYIGHDTFIPRVKMDFSLWYIVSGGVVDFSAVIGQTVKLVSMLHLVIQVLAKSPMMYAAFNTLHIMLCVVSQCSVV